MKMMSGQRLSTPRDYLALIVRRKWLIVVTFLGCLGLALVAASAIPNEYVSESLILFRPGGVSTDLVKEITDGTPEERLTVIQETILSRSHLMGIIREFSNTPLPYRGLSDERKVARLRDRIDLEIIAEKVGSAPGPVSHLRIRYREQDPELARNIANRLSSLFVDQDNRTREEQVFGTTKFLQAELTRVMARLTESGNRLKAIKEHYRDELPSQLEANLAALERLQLQKTANSEALDRQATLQITLESQLSQTSPKIPSDGGPAMAMRTRNPLLDSYLKKESEYKDLVAKATDRHPDVIRLRSELEALRKSIPPEAFDSVDNSDPGRVNMKTEPNPLYVSLMAQLRQVKTEIEIRKRERRWIDGQIAENTRKVQNTPRAEQEIAEIERNNVELTKQADDLRLKLDQANLSQKVQSTQQGAQFVIVDSANLPAEPAAPNRLAIQMSGIGLSLAAALLVGIFTDLSRRRVFTSAELERLLRTPVLVEIPRIFPSWHSLRLRRMRLKYAAIFLIGAGMYGWGLYHLHSNPDPLLRILDPILQQKAGTNAKK